MPNSKVLTQAEAREALDILAKWFETKTVNLRWMDRTRRGHAYYKQGLVSIGPNCWRGTTDSLLHEFSHILCWRLGQQRRMRQHNTANPRQYGWHTEYANIRAYAKREGIYQAPESYLARLNREIRDGVWVEIGRITDLQVNFAASDSKETK